MWVVRKVKMGIFGKGEGANSKQRRGAWEYTQSRRATPAEILRDLAAILRDQHLESAIDSRLICAYLKETHILYRHIVLVRWFRFLFSFLRWEKGYFW